MAQPGFFDFEERCQQLSAHGDPLEKLDAAIPWESFRVVLSRVHDRPRKDPSGRKPWDTVLMFKVLILQTLYGLSDGQTEYQVRDRVSFMRFLGLKLGDRVPDEKTIWLFKEHLTERGLMKELFARFEALLAERGYAAKGGSLIDASIVQVPRQRNGREENKQIKAGERPPSFDEKPTKGRQKDTDARWTVKRKVSYFGYKNHVNVDQGHKLVRRYEVTAASVHDSRMIEPLLEPQGGGREVYADSAYRSREIGDALASRHYTDRIHEKGYRNRPLDEHQVERNREKSRVRVRVEHVFGRMSQYGDRLLRCIGLIRATTRIGLRNLVYNLDRYATLRRRSPA